jgi:hypothetical protein
MVGETLGVVAGTSDPVTSSARCVAADVAICGLEIGLSFWSYDDAVSHLPDRIFASQFAKHLIGGSSHAFPGLAQSATDARDRVEMICDFLVRGSAEEHRFSFPIDGE